MKTLFKKSLFVLMVAFIAVFTLSISNKVNAAEEVYKTLTFTSTTMQTGVSSYTSTWKTKCDGDTWTIVNANNNNKGWSYIKIGRKNNASVGSIATAFAINKEVTKVVMTVDAVTTSKVNSIKLLVATDANFSNVVETVPVTAAKGALTFNISNPVINAYYKIVIDCASHTSNGVITISKVQYYADPAAAGSPTISIKGGSYTEVDDIITMEALLSNLTGDVAWTSSNLEVATVDQSGKVTALSMGTTTITAAVGEVKATQEFKVYPTDGSMLTVAEAIEVCKLTQNVNCPFVYKVQGVASDVTYNSNFSNYTFNLTDTTGTIKVYGAKGDCELQNDYNVTVSGTLINYSNSTPEFNTGSTFERIIDENLDAFLENLNAIKSYMSLAYKYTKTQKEVAAEAEVTDTLDYTLTGRTSTTYGEWSGKTSASDAVWAGQSAAGNNSIQLRSNNSNSGIVTTVSGGKVAKIIVSWNSNTAVGRTLDVYASNDAYSNPTELYSPDTQGEKIGSIVCGTTTELEVDGNYAYIGLRSNSGAMYIDSIEVVWEVEAEGTVLADVFEDVDFRIKCGVDAGIASLDNLPAGTEYTYGVYVKANSKEVWYNTEDNSDVMYSDGQKLYTVISLGDVLTYRNRLDVEFTVQSYVEVEGQKYYAEESKTYSVIDLVKEYYAMDDYADIVAPLVEVLTSMGYTFE